MVPNAAAEEEQDATDRSATMDTNRSSRVRRRKQEAEGVEVRVPVVFNQPLTIENRALLLVEVRRTACGFMYFGVTIDRSCCSITDCVRLYDNKSYNFHYDIIALIPQTRYSSTL